VGWIVVVGVSLFWTGSCPTPSIANLVPKPFATADGTDIQKLTRAECQERFGQDLFADPYGFDSAPDGIHHEEQFFADRAWNRIVFTWNDIDDEGVRYNLYVREYGSSGDESAGPDHFLHPCGLCVDRRRHDMSNPPRRRWAVYVADTGNDRIVKLHYEDFLDYPAHKVVSHADYFGQGELSEPKDVAFFPYQGGQTQGFLYVADTGNHRIVAFNLDDGSIAATFGSEGDGVGQFHSPQGIAVDVSPGEGASYIYVCDTGNGRVVCLQKPFATLPSLEWDNVYEAQDLNPVSVTAYQNCGVYVLNGYISPTMDRGSNVVSFSHRLTERLASYGHAGGGPPEEFFHPTYIALRAGQVGVGEVFGESTGIGYYVLETQFGVTSVSPRQFTPPLEMAFISHSLTSHGGVEVKVCNSNWQEVRCVHPWSEECSGIHFDWWDGRDSSQQLVAPGDYYILLRTREYGGTEIMDTDTLLVTVDAAVAPIVQIASDLEAQSPRWSPLGEEIAFCGREQSSDNFSIWAVSSLGGSPTRITYPGEMSYDDEPCWDPSGQSVCFQRRTDYSGLRLSEVYDITIWRALISNPAETQLSESGSYHCSPQWSPDGWWIAFRRADGDLNLWKMFLLNPSLVKQVTDNTGNYMYVPGSWSPDGRYVACRVNDLWQTEFLVRYVDAETGCSTILLPGAPEIVSNPRWAPDGGRVMYYQAPEEGGNPEDRGIREITTEGNSIIRSLVQGDIPQGHDCSPDGTKLVFTVWGGDRWNLAIADYLRGEDAFPVANLVSPGAYEILNGTVEILGIVDDNVSVDGMTLLSPLVSYNLEWGHGFNPSVWHDDGITVAGGVHETVEVIGTWDTAELPIGVYSLRLSASDGVDVNTESIPVYLHWRPGLDVEDGGHPTAELIPERFALSQNWPNPFNPMTTIEYSLPERSGVHLAIYSVEGRRIRTLVDGPIDAGHWLTAWDGKDENGAEVSSGVYVCRFVAESYSETRKMILLR
jgi:flagellar hook assembly protein FlgD